MLVRETSAEYTFISQESTVTKLRGQKLFIVAIVIVLADQISKLWIKGFSFFGVVHQGMYLNESRSIIGDLLRFSYVENPGMAFGVSFGAGKIFLSLFSVFAAIVLIWYLYKLRRFDRWVQVGIMLLLSGAVGNLIDRVFYGVIFNEAPLFYGKVVDFIDLDCPDFSLFGQNITRWWVFNIADSCVTMGIVVLLLFNHRIPTLKALNAPPDHITSYEDSSDSRIELADYNGQWPLEFEALKSYLSSVLGDLVLEYHHIGSTSVTGLRAKPILDLDLVIDSMEHFAQVREKLEAEGYEYEGDKGIAQREAFRQSSSRVPRGADREWMTQHLYVCPKDSVALHEHLQFRDRLRANQQLRESYSALKSELAQRFHDDRDAYTEAKTDFVHGVLEGGLDDTQNAASTESSSSNPEA